MLSSSLFMLAVPCLSIWSSIISLGVNGMDGGFFRMMAEMEQQLKKDDADEAAAAARNRPGARPVEVPK